MRSVFAKQAIYCMALSTSISKSININIYTVITVHVNCISIGAIDALFLYNTVLISVMFLLLKEHATIVLKMR